MLAVITNIDADHLSTYEGDFQRLRQTFVEFLHHLPFYGLAVLCLDDPNVRDVLPEITRQVRSYGIDSDDADIRAVNIRQQGQQMHFEIHQADHVPLAVVLNLPGHHNVLNALAAVAIARELVARHPAVSLSFIVRPRSFEQRTLAQEGFALDTVAIGRIAGQGLLRRLRTMVELPVAVWRAADSNRM